MKLVVFDSPYVDKHAFPAIGKALKRGEETPLTDEQAEIALQNPHVRLASDKETATQRVRREEREAAERAKASEAEESDATKSDVVIAPPPPKPDLTAQTVQPSAAVSTP